MSNRNLGTGREKIDLESNQSPLILSSVNSTLILPFGPVT